jgi:hypothetical protein
MTPFVDDDGVEKSSIVDERRHRRVAGAPTREPTN